MVDKVRSYLARRGYKEVFGDVNLVFGGLFYNSLDEAAIQISDLSSAAPSVEGNLVEYLRVVGVEDAERRKLALRCFGINSEEEIPEDLSDEQRRLLYVNALVSYGSYDVGACISCRTEKGVDLKDWGKGSYSEPVDGWGQAAMIRAIEWVIWQS